MLLPVASLWNYCLKQTILTSSNDFYFNLNCSIESQSQNTELMHIIVASLIHFSFTEEHWLFKLDIFKIFCTRHTASLTFEIFNFHPFIHSNLEFHWCDQFWWFKKNDIIDLSLGEKISVISLTIWHSGGFHERFASIEKVKIRKIPPKKTCKITEHAKTLKKS